MTLLPRSSTALCPPPPSTPPHRVAHSPIATITTTTPTTTRPPVHPSLHPSSYPRSGTPHPPTTVLPATPCGSLAHHHHYHRHTNHHSSTRPPIHLPPSAPPHRVAHSPVVPWRLPSLPRRQRRARPWLGPQGRAGEQPRVLDQGDLDCRGLHHHLGSGAARPRAAGAGESCPKVGGASYPTIPGSERRRRRVGCLACRALWSPCIAVVRAGPFTVPFPCSSDGGSGAGGGCCAFVLSLFLSRVPLRARSSASASKPGTRPVSGQALTTT